MSHLFEDGDYALSKDIDVALWKDYRAYHTEQPLRVAMDFVVVMITYTINLMNLRRLK